MAQRWMLALGVAYVACGASTEEVIRAREARYDAPFSEVWNVVSQEMHRRYVGIHIDDPSHGVIETDFRVVQSLQEDVGATTNTQATGGATSGVGGATSQQRSLNNYTGDVAIFRMTVIVQGPPWKIVVDGVAAKYDQGSPVPVPYHHGAIDEPPWVEQRIANLTTAIYDRLKKYAVVVKAKDKKEEKTDLTAWQNLDDKGLSETIGNVRKVAIDRNIVGLRPFMIADFRWADGADTSADTAIAIWSADPTAMRALARTLDGGCALEKAGDAVCPVRETTDAGHAKFRHVGSAWKLIEFVR